VNAVDYVLKLDKSRTPKLCSVKKMVEAQLRQSNGWRIWSVNWGRGTRAGQASPSSCCRLQSRMFLVDADEMIYAPIQTARLRFRAMGGWATTAPSRS
jgi:hypothetical protein